jgi:maltose alpha-D-glucosyltransferase/alpha-amylase
MAELLLAEAFEILRESLPSYLPRCRWFASKASRIASVGAWEDFPMGEGPFPRLLFLNVSLDDGSLERYALPISCVTENASLQGQKNATICQGRDYFLADGVFDPTFRSLILEVIAKGKNLSGSRGKLTGLPNPAASKAFLEVATSGDSRVLSAEQSNTSIVYGDRLFLKLYRKVEEGPHPEGEMVHFLTEAGFSHVPPFMGFLRCEPADGGLPFEVALLQGCIKNKGDAWSYFTRALELSLSSLDEVGAEDETRGTFAMASLLGKRTAEMHIALASEGEDPAFAPVPFEGEYKRRALEAAYAQLDEALAMLERHIGDLQGAARALALRVLEKKKRASDLLETSFAASGGEALRIHGDYHLGQVLFTGDDFFIVDFEGEPARSLSERRRKQSPLKDVAGMVRSFHYAANFALRKLDDKEMSVASSRAKAWYRAVCELFTSSYRKAVREAPFLPQKEGAFEVILKAFLVEKAAYEVCYELNNRPDWVEIPLEGIASILEVED